MLPNRGWDQTIDECPELAEPSRSPYSLLQKAWLHGGTDLISSSLTHIWWRIGWHVLADASGTHQIHSSNVRLFVISASGFSIFKCAFICHLGQWVFNVGLRWRGI